MQPFDRRNLVGEQTYRGGQGASLVVDVGAETPDALAHEAEVHRTLAVEFLTAAAIEQGQHQGANAFV